jgi:hypothetical protein
MVAMVAVQPGICIAHDQASIAADFGDSHIAS